MTTTTSPDRFGDPDRDRGWLREAVELSRRCPVSASAFSVGAIVVADGREVTRGHSREEDPHDHAEEVALRRLTAPTVPRDSLTSATLYSSLEPCGSRKSRPRPCAELIVASGMGRVVFAWREPSLFASGGGATRLRTAGIEVVELSDLAAAARQVNAHLFPGRPG